MLAIWLTSAAFLGAYIIIQNLSIPLIIQPQLFAALAAICWAQCLHYDSGWSQQKAIAFTVGSLVLFGGVECALIFGAKVRLLLLLTGTDDRSRLLRRAGTVRQRRRGAYYQRFSLSEVSSPSVRPIPTRGTFTDTRADIEIYRYKAVIGISLIFLLIDLLGGLFSTLSLLFAAGPFDVLASISYAAVVFLELGVLALAAILNPAHRRRVALKLKEDEDALADTTSTRLATPPLSPASSTATVLETDMEEVPAKGPLGWMDEGVSEAEARESRHTHPRKADHRVGRSDELALIDLRRSRFESPSRERGSGTSTPTISEDHSHV